MLSNGETTPSISLKDSAWEQEGISQLTKVCRIGNTNYCFLVLMYDGFVHQLDLRLLVVNGAWLTSILVRVNCIGSCKLSKFV